MVNITYEIDQYGQLFAHITADKPFGHAKYIKENIPINTLVTVPPNLQPGITYILTKHCGFQHVKVVEAHDVLIKVE